MRIVDVRARTVAVSRYADPGIPSGNLTTTALALITDVERDGEAVVGFGFSSIGRFGQTGLILERFAPRLLAAPEGDLLDPFAAWDVLMKDEKPGGHGERCVAVGTLDMALWDAAAKIAGQPLYRYLQERLGRPRASARVPVYAGGGYYFPDRELDRLRDEVRGFLDCGYTSVKIKIGGRSLAEDLRRIEAVLALLPDGRHLAVDAMNRYRLDEAIEMARAIAGYGLRWFEDMIDPLDFEGHREIAGIYAHPIGLGEATFSVADARNLIRYAGLRADRDVLIFDPAHCYGLPEYLRIVSLFENAGWSQKSFQPHGGHLFSLHVAAALGLGGSEANPGIFQPFGGFSDGVTVEDGFVAPPEEPGIGFESRAELGRLFREVAG